VSIFHLSGDAPAYFLDFYLASFKHFFMILVLDGDVLQIIHGKVDRKFRGEPAAERFYYLSQVFQSWKGIYADPASAGGDGEYILRADAFEFSDESLNDQWDAEELGQIAGEYDPDAICAGFYGRHIDDRRNGNQSSLGFFCDLFCYG
jgi:hypothetical protein